MYSNSSRSASLSSSYAVGAATVTAVSYTHLDVYKRQAHACAAVSSLDILVNDNPTLTVAEMNAQCRRLNNLGLVMIDYLQLMQGSGSKNSWASESRQQVVSDISRMMKIMAKELNVPVLCLSLIHI